MTYFQFLDEITPYAEEEFAKFQRKLIFTPRKIMGIRTPTLRKLTKALAVDVETLFSYPDEYCETVFIKLTAVSLLPYERFVEYLPRAVALMDNWALCDCFKGKCIVKRKEEFLSVLEGLFLTGKEYFVRYVLVTLLSYYVEERYLPTVIEYLKRADTTPYYVYMAAAWLTAEIVVKYFDDGVALLQSGMLDERTKNKAIQKALESYRLTVERKEYLRSLKGKR